MDDGQQTNSLLGFGSTVAQLDLLRVVGQELKLPLTHIANAASMLSDNDMSEQELSNQYQQLEITSRRMIQLVDSILFAGQVETNQTQLNLTPTNVAAVAHKVVEELNGISKLYETKVNLRVTQALSPAAVDPVALRHTIFGILDVLIRTSKDEIDILVHHQTDSVMITMRSPGPAFSLTAITDAIRRMGKAAQPIRQLPNTTGMAFFVAHSLTAAMSGKFFVTHSSGKRNIAIKLPLSAQLELV